jgi:uncharacterized protein YprB with RNaseH-like and TPR domain
MDVHEFLVIDIETSGGSMDNIPIGFQLLLAGVRLGSTYLMYTSERASLAQLHGHLAGFNGPIVTFNGTHFDLPILDHWMQKTLGKPLSIPHHYDLMVEIRKVAGRRISLDRISRYTFGQEKLSWDHRRNSQVWEEEPQRLIDYNRVDLDLTHELFSRVIRGEYLFLGDASIQLDLSPAR